MYIIKIKGTQTIPDCVQIRDQEFSLLAYFRCDRPEKALSKIGLGASTDKIKEIIEKIPFGELRTLELEKA